MATASPSPSLLTTPLSVNVTPTAGTALSVADSTTRSGRLGELHDDRFSALLRAMSRHAHRDEAHRCGDYLRLHRMRYPKFRAIACASPPASSWPAISMSSAPASNVPACTGPRPASTLGPPCAATSPPIASTTSGTAVETGLPPGIQQNLSCTPGGVFPYGMEGGFMHPFPINIDT